MRWMTSLIVVVLLVPASSRAQVGSVPGAPTTPATATADQPQETAALRGRVLAGDTGQPLRQAQVALTMMDAKDSKGNHISATDADGKYEFTDLAAGRYVILVVKSPYIPLSYGQTRPFEAGMPIMLLKGQTIERLDVTLPRGSVVRGRIVDEYGDPMANLQIAAMRSQTVNGQRRLTSSSRMATTDDLGEFRLYDLPPGDYYVQATWRKTPGAVGSSDDGVGYAQTFYPSTTDVAQAQRVTVGIGTMVSDIAIAMSPVTTTTVSGTVVDSAGQPMNGGMVMVIQNNAGMMNRATSAQVRPDGSFTLASLTPGEYTLQAQIHPGGDEAAVMTVTVAATDITGLRLVGTRASTVSGRIVIDPGQTLQANTLTAVATPAQAGSFMLIGMTPGKVGDDNTFTLKSAAGLMRIRVAGLPKGWDIRAVQLRGTNVTDSGIEIKPKEDVEGVDVELTNRLTSVVGLVTDARGDAAKDYTALIFPQDQNLWSNPGRYIKTARPDQDGRFTIAGLPPGDYYALALDHIEPEKISDPEFLNTVRSSAKSFSLSEGETKSLDLKLSTGS